MRMTHSSGLLILSQALQRQKLTSLFLFAKDVVRSKLFVTVPQACPTFGYWKNAVSLCYTTASEVCPSLDVRLILPLSTKAENPIQFDVVLSQLNDTRKARSFATQFDPLYENDILIASVADASESTDPESDFDPNVAPVNTNFLHVCLGGTFDRLHNGHKILLSIGGLLASERLLVGVTSSTILKRKKLAPLIFSWKRRAQDVREFLNEIGITNSKLEIVKLKDAFGPPAVLPEFQCIVTSPEVASTCEQLNKIRQEKGFKPLAIEVIDFVSDSKSSEQNVPPDLYDSKLSSSTNRFNLLGTLLRPVNPQGWSRRGPRAPYVIGLAGPSGAGKSALARRLEGLSSSVHVIDCDRLGHEAYTPGTKCHEMLLSHFGRDAIASADPPYPIDRSRLGKLVFSDPERLKQLNAIVWPEIERRVNERLLEIETKTATGSESTKSSLPRPVVVLDAAVLLQAKWDRMCDEIWIAVLPRDEAKRRICERMNLEPDVVDDRLDRQAAAISEATGGMDWWCSGQLDQGLGPVGHAHVVLSTEWEPECSQRQVERAFRGLCDRMTP